MAEPFLYETVDALYKGVMGNMPPALQERDVACAFVLGSTGSYAATRLVQWLSKCFLSTVIPNLESKWLPRVEKAVAVAVAAAPVAYAFIDPDGVRAIMTQHPAYASGMTGACIGTALAAAKDIEDSSKNTSIDDRFSE
ncbi:hypothetical protein HZB90_01495 [archaeon]|nr:hypothetical protein [archaeon]